MLLLNLEVHMTRITDTAYPQVIRDHLQNEIATYATYITKKSLEEKWSPEKYLAYKLPAELGTMLEEAMNRAVIAWKIYGEDNA